MDELLTVQDAAIMLQVTPKKVRDYITSGALKAHKLGATNGIHGHLWRIWQKDLEKFINGES